MADLVIFDCDGVLVDSEVISARMLIDALAQLGVMVDIAYVARHFLGRSYPTVMATIRKDFGLDLPPAFEDDYRTRLLAAFERELQIMPHVGDVMDRLRLPFCVATSSSPRRAEISLRLVGFADRIGPRIYTSSLVARGKPAPDLFLYAADKMGVDPGRCLVIEDSLTGIRAGLAAGMEVWRFTGGSHLKGQVLDTPDDARPHRVFDSFADFFQIDPSRTGSPKEAPK